MYRITLIQGQFFNRGETQTQEFFTRLFQNFSILSWLDQSCNIRVIDQKLSKFNQRQWNTYYYTFLNDKNERKLVQFQKNEQQHSLCYLAADQLEDYQISQKIDQFSSKKQYSVKVVISIHRQTSKLKRMAKQNESKSQTKNVIFVDIEDKANLFASLQNPNQDRTLSLKKKLNDNQIEYFYKEPLTRRNKETQYCHFNLAFQGGGAKGVSYVGVYKALKELHKGIPINSIIGSSAGGILALAISTEMKPEAITGLCLQMDTIPEDKYFKHENEISGEIQGEFDSQIEKIKNILHNEGLLEDSIFSQVLQALSDLQTSEKILKVLSYVNPSLEKLFTLQINPVTKKNGFMSTKTYTKRFNYYGLLNAGLMNGTAVENIAANCIIDYFSKHFKPSYSKAHPHYAQRTLRIKKVLQSWNILSEDQEQLQSLLGKEQNFQKVKKLTLKQFYEISEVELTCTSVDLEDKILRFFNHKTTPDLPVCKTVQMTGSFPVAFMAQKWQKQWGKYYVHYENSRKQIDLTGHIFTDGGLLANFPVKYLDNELMRPMYFSHKKNPKYTILYGFGLDQIESKTVDIAAERLIQQAVDELKSHISSKLSKLQLVKNLLFSDSKKELPVTKLQEIPLLNYLIKLFSTFTVADYNLNIECFQKNIVLTEVEHQVISSTKQVKQEVGKFNQLQQYLQTLKNCILTKSYGDPVELIKVTCTKAMDIFNQYETVNNDLIEKLKNQFLIGLYNYQGTRIKYQFNQSKEINQIIREAQNIYSSQRFKMQDSASAKTKVLACITRVHQHFSSISQTEKTELKSVVDRMMQQQLSTLSVLSNKVKTILKCLSQSGEHIHNDIYHQYTSIDDDLIYELANMQSKFFLLDQPYVREILSNIYSLDLPLVKVQNNFLQNAGKIRTQLASIIKHGEHDRIHLVLQSKEYSHYYFCSLFQILQNILHQPENANKNIDMITTSDLQSVFAFLYAGGMNMKNIRKQMWVVKDLVTIQDKITQQFDKYKWAQASGRQMQELLQLTWSDHYQIFDEVQKYLLKEGDNNLSEQVGQMRTEFLYSKSLVTNNMEEILDYVTKSCFEAMKIKDDPELQKKRLAQFLSLKNGQYGKDYKAKNKMISENTQHLMRIMMVHFEGILVNLILNHSIINGTFDCSDPVTAEKVWKGTLIKKLLTSKKLELYIKSKLEEMKLNSSTTLSEYYEFCRRKVTLNFCLINKNKERVEMVNRFTRPNMPVWAAIIASTSMPYLLPDVNFLQQWQYSSFLDSRMRKLVNYFFSSKEDKLQQSFFSANFVSSLPLQLLTNQKIAKQNFTALRDKQERYFAQNKLTQTLSTQSNLASKVIPAQNGHTFVTFSFKIMQNTKQKETKGEKIFKYQKKFINFSNLLSIGFDMLLGKFKNVEVGLKDIMKRLQLMKYVAIRLQCHDNTIMNLYYDQTVRLPIELGTLDFYKINEGKTHIVHHCIYQSEFVVRGIFENLWISQDKQQFGYLSKKETYLQYLLFDEKIMLKFISKSKWNKKLATMYRIFWKLQQKGNYAEYDDEMIVFPAQLKHIYLKFDYPDMDNVVRKSNEMLLNFQKLLNLKDQVFFKFNYQKLDKRYLIPVPLFSQKLRTRIIPKSNAFITESKIEQPSAEMMIKSNESPSQCKLNQKPQPTIYQLDENFAPHEIKLKKKKTTLFLQPQKFKQVEAQSEKEITHSPYLFIKALVNFKNDGLLCHGCIKPLKRAQNITLSGNKCDSVEIGQCSRCKSQSVIIGYECKTRDCRQKDNNRYCFECLFVYLLEFEEGVCRCSQFKHEMKLVQREAEVMMCHFCQSAATNYYRDHICNINVCYKCSLVLDSKKKF